MYVPPPPQLHHQNNHVNSAPQVISCCCCECIRMNSHLLRRQSQDHGHQSSSNRYQYTNSDTDEEEMCCRPRWRPSGCYNVNLKEKRRFFEHLNFVNDSSEDEWCRNCGPLRRPKHRAHHKWHKPHQRRRKWCPPSCGFREFRRPQHHVRPPVRDYSCHQDTQTDCMHHRQEHRGTNAEQQRFYQKNFHHGQHPYSDMEYPQHVRTTLDQTSMHHPRMPDNRRPLYSFNYQADRPPYEVVNIWRRPRDRDEGNVKDESHESRAIETGHDFHQKTSRLRHQSSRNYLNSLQRVTSIRTEWEERMAKDPNFKYTILGRRMPGGNNTSASKPEGQSQPRTSPFTITQQLVERSHEVSSHLTENVDLKLEHRTEVTARHSNSSPMLSNKDTPDKGQTNPRAKSVPRPSKFKHPEYEHLNLSGMKIPGSPGSNSGELKPKINQNSKEQSGAQGEFAKKYFGHWKNATRKFPVLERKGSLKDGLLVLTKSKSQQEITTYEFGRLKAAAGASAAPSIASAPPQVRPKRWFQFLDSINPWAPTEDEDLGPASILPDKATAEHVDVDFAIEIVGQIPTERARSVTNATEEALRRLSEDYDSVVVANTRKESLDIQVSTLAFNATRENIDHERRAKSKARRSIKNQSDGRKQSAISVTHTKHENRTVIGHRICQFCKQLITEPVEPHKIIQVQGKNMFWHRKCFKCTECEKLLDSQHHYFWKGNVYCTEHYANIAQVPRCNSCHEYIFDPTITLAMGHTWHKHHFQCLNCKRPLIDTKFVKVGSDSAICFDCQQKLHSKKCVFCGEYILPTEVYVRSGNCFWHSNDTCMNCQTCGRNLSHDTKIFVRQGKTYCNRYCAQMNVSPAAVLAHENPEKPA